MWEAEVEGRLLHFSLIGINNQNFLMQDRETGSWWQQISGQAIQGPLKGRRLKLVDHDELTFATWRAEVGNGRVLRPDPKIASSSKYATPDWETRISKLPVPIDPPGGEGITARTLIVGITIGETSKAYPTDLLEKQNPIQDSVDAEPICLVLNSDGKSVRAFSRQLGTQTFDFFRVLDSQQFQMVDSQTGTHWNFAGRAISGPLTGKELRQIYSLKDYWFDWKNYHAKTLVYRLK